MVLRIRPARFCGTRAEIPRPAVFLSGSSFSYDPSGNTLSDGTYSYTWNGESQMKTAAGVTYAYDGDGRRVYKSSGKLYWYGAGDEILAETDGSGNTTAEYIFFGGKRVAMLPAGSNPIFYAEDFLGTSRVVTQNNGVVCYDGDFTPFGGELSWTNTCPQNYKFEGKERDTETSNDEFGARSYSWRFGRWLSADWSSVPVPVPYANLTNPQTLNLYAMVADDPESFADLDGHGPTIVADDTQAGCFTGCAGVDHDKNANATAAQDAAKGAAASVGAQATQDAAVRARYVEGASKLQPGDGAARTALKAEARAASSPAGQAIAEAMRPMAGEAARTAGNAAKTNEGVNAALGVAGKVGPALLAVGVAASVYTVATASDKPRAAAGEGGAWAGALSFGAIGAVAGAKAGAVVGALFGGAGAAPGAAIGAVVGAVGGGAVGAVVGSRAGKSLFDLLH